MTVTFVIVAAAVVAFVLFTWKPELGIYVVFVEAIWGGIGHWLEFGPGLTPRYLLLPLAVAAALLSKILRQQRTVRFPWMWIPLVAFGCVLLLGTVEGVYFGNPGPVAEAQAWLYLLMYPLVMDLWNRKAVVVRLIRLLLWGAAGMSAVQLLLTVIMNTFGSIPESIHERLGQMRITTPLLAGTHFFYAFWSNSSIAGFAVAICTLLLARRSGSLGFSRMQLWLMAALSTAGMIVMMTRGTWGQLIVSVALVGFDLLCRRKLSPTVLIAAITLAAVMITSVLTYNEMREALVKRFETLLPSNRALLPDDDSIVAKAKESKELRHGIAARPVFGWGFGEVSDPSFGLEGHTRFHNYFLGLALKTGLVGLAVLAWLLATAIAKGTIIAHRVRQLFPEQRDLLYAFVYGLAGAILVTTTNPHLGTPALIQTIAVMFMWIDVVHSNLVQQEARRWRLRNGGYQHLHSQLQLKQPA
jgi:hypothetical protein